jgi:acylphosphatase
MKAREAHVTGYIHNVYHKPDEFGPHGGVEAVLQGEEESIHDMLEYLREGSPMSRVDDMEYHYEDPAEIFEEFTVLKSQSFSPHE